MEGVAEVTDRVSFVVIKVKPVNLTVLFPSNVSMLIGEHSIGREYGVISLSFTAA